MSIFQKSVIKRHLKHLDNDKVNLAYDKYRKFYGDTERLQNIMQLKEENYQEGFLREIFVQVLGYTINPDKNYNLTTEYKNLTDSRKADGAILKNGKAIGVIELKSTKTKDPESIKEQAFGYKVNQPDCKYVITSNFQRLRLYIDNATEYEEFDLFDLSKDRFKIFYLLLHKDSLLNHLPDKLKQETKFHDQRISEKLYSDYQAFKDRIFKNLVSANPKYDKLTLFKKSQKLLDRILFILFAEDSGLIPPNAISKIIEQWKQYEELEDYKPLYSRFQLFFRHLDKGHTYKKWGEIPAYNGGLFRYDEILDNPALKLPDGLLQNHTQILSAYDFSSEVDVNILGHIFEHSLSEIEEMEQELTLSKVETLTKFTPKRKKDGIFYTPKYITKYIVEHTIGTLCDGKKEEWQLKNILIDDTFRLKNGTLNKKGKQLLNTLHAYKEWLLTLKILDPACGSGAFLNQTLEFLTAEHKEIDDKIAELTGESPEKNNTDKAILENNIYGVDINEESVEIAKLSLWLRTARRGRPLSDLSGNIKCGNSLIDDPNIAGEKAFDWEKEFPHVFNPDVKEKVYQNIPEEKPDYVELVKTKSKEAQGKAEQAAKLSKEALEISKQVYEYAEKISTVNEPKANYNTGKGGFDVVLGNPPYGVVFDKKTKKYLTKFDDLVPDYEIYIYFISLATKKLLKTNGSLGYIFPNTFLSILYGEKYRKKLLDNFKITEIVDLSTDHTFTDAAVRTCIFALQNKKQANYSVDFKSINPNTKKVTLQTKHTKQYLQQNTGNWLSLSSIGKSQQSVIRKIKNNSVLNEFFDVSQGYIPYRRSDLVKKYGNHGHKIVDKRLWHSEEKISEEYKQEILGKNLFRYYDSEAKSFIKYGKHVASYVAPKFFTQPRVLIREITGKTLNCSYIEKELYNNPSIINIITKDNSLNLKYLLAILNSKLIGWYHNSISPKAKKGLFPKILINDVRNIPVKLISKAAQQPFIEKADLMLSLNKSLQSKKSNFLKTIQEEKGIKRITKKLDAFYELEYDAFKKELHKQKVKISLGNENDEWREYFNTTKQKLNEMQNQINQTDTEIDRMVYELYELTPEEIEIVESATDK